MIFGLIFTSCEPPVAPPQVGSQPPVNKQVDTLETQEDIQLTHQEEHKTIELGEAHFYTDSISVLGEGFSFSKHVSYGRVLILFDEDGKIIKVETLESLPFKQINKNTIYLLKGANLTLISRHFGIPIERLRDCNDIQDENVIPALTRFKLNCNN